MRGALKNVGYEVGRNTIKRILKEQGIEPAPLRRRQYSWATFIKAHLSAISAADFFTVEVLSWAGLVRYHVFFVMDLASRRVEIAGISRCPDGLWMEQVARNLLDAGDGFLLGKRYLILDRDPLYTREFRAAMKRGGVEVLRLPPSSPNLNAYAERFVLSIRSECLDRIVPLGEAHLRRSISEFVRHYRFERNHQGLGNDADRERAEPGEHERSGRATRTARRVAQLLPSGRRECASIQFRTRRQDRLGPHDLAALRPLTRRQSLALQSQASPLRFREPDALRAGSRRQRLLQCLDLLLRVLQLPSHAVVDRRRDCRDQELDRQRKHRLLCTVALVGGHFKLPKRPSPRDTSSDDFPDTTAAPENGDLLAKGEILDGQVGAGAEGRSDGSDYGEKEREHPPILRPWAG